jgi:uncharacterized protein (TIGR00297 family)
MMPGDAGRPSVAPPAHSEDARQLVHISMGGFALLLRYIPWWQAALLASVALAFNLVVLPRVGRALYRPDDRSRQFPTGIVLYPVAVLLLILVFPYRLDIAAAAWGVLAAGDGMATIVGRRAGRRRIPWNREKTIAGSVALFLFGGLAAAGLAWWCRPSVIPPPSPWFSLVAPFVAALVAAFVETIPVRLNDNVSVPATAAAVLWALSLVSADLMVAATMAAGQALLPALVVNLIAASLGYRAGTVSLPGAICGAVIGVVVAVAAGWPGWTLLFVTFLAASISSRLGLQRKTLLGIAEERGGRRGAGNAIANTGFAAAAAFMSVATYAHDQALVAFAAALTAGGSDTIASEIGKAWGTRAYLVPTFKAAVPGTSGAMSLEGTMAGLLGASGLAAAALLLGLIPGRAWLPVVVGATLGSVVESLLGATLEGPGILNNDLLNFLNTAVAGIVAVFILSATT